MLRNKDIGWWYWLATDLLLAGAVFGCPLGFAPVIGLTAWQVLHYHSRESSMGAFPVQVRLGYLGLLLMGQYEPLYFVYWIQLVGTTAMVLFDYCPLARFLSLMPWNRRERFTLRLAYRTFVSRPVRGSILQGLPAE